MYYNESEARRQVVEAGRKMLENKLLVRTWGNISARISADEFVITPSGRAYDDLEPSDLVKVRIEDGSYDGDIKPSSEKGIHATAYSLRSDVDFIAHTHQFFASTVAAECRNVEFAPCAGYGLPGSEKLRKQLEKCISENPDGREFLMARHGALILGTDYEDTFSRASELEDSCRELVERRVQSHDHYSHESFDSSEINIKAFPHVKVVSDPFILKCCRKGTNVGPYLDDFAQIVGVDMQVVDNDPWKIERALLGYSTTQSSKSLSKMPMTGVLPRMGGQQPALNKVIGRNAVLVKGVGAVCVGKTEMDAEAVGMIVSKNCCAACYIRDVKPLSKMDALIMRFNYLAKYSKRIGD